MTPDRVREPERPLPLRTLLLAGAQHCAVILGVGLAMPLIILGRGDLPAETIRTMMSLGLIALAVATLLQIRRGGWFGSSFLAPATFTAAYLPPCIAAMEKGGPPLVMGMLMLAGLAQVALAPALRRLRPYLPPEIGGLAVLMIGIVLGLLGLRLIGDAAIPATPAPDVPAMAWLGALTLALIAGMSVWGKGGLRLFATLTGISIACLISAFTGALDHRGALQGLPLASIAFPVPAFALPAFDVALVPAFLISAVACSLRAMGDIITCQKIVDPNWVRPHIDSIRAGVTADGLGTAFAGLIGSPIGINTFSGSIGLSAATGLTSRRIGYAIAGLLLLIAMLPGVLGFFIAIPEPVLGGVLIFSAAYIIFNGLSVIVSRLLDARRILVLGIALTLGIGRDAFPALYDALPAPISYLAGSDMTVAISVALLLNLIFRIGIRRRVTLEEKPDALTPDSLRHWVQEQGGFWGARADVMRDVEHALIEFLEARHDLAIPVTSLDIEMSFDEYHVDLAIRYRGQALPIGLAGPIAPEELPDLDEEKIEARLRANLLRHLASSVSGSTEEDGRHILRMRFEH